MPIYFYQAESGSCGHCRHGFECLQKLSSPPLAACPQCGCAVHRVPAVPHLAGGTRLDSRTLASHGFTQYRRIARGRYEKTAGRGPPTLDAGD